MKMYKYEHMDVHIHLNKESYRLYREFNGDWLTPKQVRKFWREKQKVARLFKKVDREVDE